MKTIKILSALAAVCALVIGCAKEGLNVYDEIQVSSSYIGLSNNEGTNSKTITVTAKDSWSATGAPEWLSISPASGGAGESSVTFSAVKASETREATIKLVCAGKTQNIIVKQEAEKVELQPITVEEALKVCKEFPGGEQFRRVKGIVCKIQEIDTGQYGNATFYISDDGSFGKDNWLEIYRGYWFEGKKFAPGDGFAVGDEITIEGNLMLYGGSTPETVQYTAYVVELNKSLISVDEAYTETLPLEGGQFDVKLICKGDGVSIKIAEDAKSWLSVAGIKTSGEKATVTFLAASNAGGDRSTDITFLTTSEGKEYSANTTVAQAGAIIDCTIAEFNAAPVGETQYRISGIVTKLEQDSEKYGANLYIKDATGETYIYGTTDATGTVKTLASFGAKEGDIVEFVGKRAEHSGNPQIAKAVYQWHKSVTPMTAAAAMALEDDDKSDPKNYVKLTGEVTDGSASGHKFDLKTYGNFDLVDESGAAYVYGVSTGWKGETKKFESLGVKEGDIITIVGYKTSYTSGGVTTNEIVGMYVSHESGEAPEPVGDDMVITKSDVPTKYPTEATTYTINGYDYSILNVANYGDGIQMKKGGSYISSLTSAKRAIASVRVDANMEKYPADAQFGWDPSNIKLYVKAAADGEEVPVAGVKDDTGITYTVAEGDYKFFTLKNESSFAVYLDTITATVVAE